MKIANLIFEAARLIGLSKGENCQYGSNVCMLFNHIHLFVCGRLGVEGVQLTK